MYMYTLHGCYTGTSCLCEMLTNQRLHNKCIFHNPLCARYEGRSYVLSVNNTEIEV